MERLLCIFQARWYLEDSINPHLEFGNGFHHSFCPQFALDNTGFWKCWYWEYNDSCIVKKVVTLLFFWKLIHA